MCRASVVVTEYRRETTGARAAGSWLLRFDAGSGEQLGIDTFAGSPVLDLAATDDGLVFAGITSGSLDVLDACLPPLSSGGDWDTFAAAFDYDLDFRWASLAGGSGSDTRSAFVAVAPDGRVALAGTTTITTQGQRFQVGDRSFAGQLRGYAYQLNPTLANYLCSERTNSAVSAKAQ